MAAPPLNRHRGEVAVTIDGVAHPLRLTLQALAEMESAFGVADLAALGARLSSGRLSAADVPRLLGPPLRAAGAPFDEAAIARAMRAEEIPGASGALATLFATAFGAGEAQAGEGEPARPFARQPDPA